MFNSVRFCLTAVYRMDKTVHMNNATTTEALVSDLSDADLVRIIRCRQLKLVARDDFYGDDELDAEAAVRGFASYSSIMNAEPRTRAELAADCEVQS